MEPTDCRPARCRACWAAGVVNCYHDLKRGFIVGQRVDRAPVVLGYLPCGNCAVLPSTSEDRLCDDCREERLAVARIASGAPQAAS